MATEAKDINFGGDARRGGDCGSGREVGTPPILLPPGARLVENPVTGTQVILMPPRKGYRCERSLKFPVENLKCFYDQTGSFFLFEWVRAEATDESDARDAQSRAGWSDTGYGFYSFKFEDGIATWSCSRSCE